MPSASGLFLSIAHRPAGSGANSAASSRAPHPQTAASVHLGLLILVLVGSLSSSGPLLRAPRMDRPVMPLAPAPQAVTIIDATPRGTRCEEQTWPYFTRECLNYARGEQAPPIVSPVPRDNAAGTAEKPAREQPLSPQIDHPAVSGFDAGEGHAMTNNDTAETPGYGSTEDEAEQAQPEMRPARPEGRRRARGSRSLFGPHRGFAFGPFRF